jgi:hypothetical protein
MYVFLGMDSGGDCETPGSKTARVRAGCFELCISYLGGGKLLGWVRDEFRKGRVYILRYFSYSVHARSNPRAAKLTL